MTNGLLSANHSRSRFVSLLSHLTNLDFDVSPEQFSERLSLFIKLGDAIKLSDALYEAGKAEVDDTVSTRDNIRMIFLRRRSALVSALLNAPLPGDKEGIAVWQKKYGALQSTLEAQVAQLRQRIREWMSGKSEALSRLSLLDAAMEASLSSHSRSLFAAVPRMLPNRYSTLQTKHPDSWHYGFSREVHSLLLAELELRLQPLMGLLEAIEDADASKHKVETAQ